MWSFASNAIAGNIAPRNGCVRPGLSNPDCSDDDASSCTSIDDRLECPICWESFNIVENVPYVLWCGHTLCKNCVLSLQWAVVKFPTAPIQLPLFISCPWCNVLSFRLVYKGNLKFPRKNFFLLWMVESMNGDRAKSHTSFSGDHQSVWPSSSSTVVGSHGHHHHSSRRALHMHPEQSASNVNHRGPMVSYLYTNRINTFRKSLAFFVNLTAKFPFVIIFLLIVLYAIPASAAILVLYILVTILFALPSFLILYFAYPSLEWLVREIIT